MTKVHKVDTFSKVELVPNTLVLIDIDETILYYENIDESWWKEKIDHYVKRHRCSRDEAIGLVADDDWFRHIQENHPKHTDEVGLKTLLEAIEKNNSDLHFITARNQKYNKITTEHFIHLGLRNLANKVHYLGGGSKGEYIKNNFNTSTYNRIVFIDDLGRNIASVRNALGNNVNLTAYQFVINRRMLTSACVGKSTIIRHPGEPSEDVRCLRCDRSGTEVGEPRKRRGTSPGTDVGRFKVRTLSPTGASQCVARCFCTTR
jgi:hypothetical protein